MHSKQTISAGRCCRYYYYGFSIMKNDYDYLLPVSEFIIISKTCNVRLFFNLTTLIFIGVLWMAHFLGSWFRINQQIYRSSIAVKWCEDKVANATWIVSATHEVTAPPIDDKIITPIFRRYRYNMHLQWHFTPSRTERDPILLAQFIIPNEFFNLLLFNSIDWNWN